jgi:hypothetical protein
MIGCHTRRVRHCTACRPAPERAGNGPMPGRAPDHRPAIGGTTTRRTKYLPGSRQDHCKTWSLFRTTRGHGHRRLTARPSRTSTEKATLRRSPSTCQPPCCAKLPQSGTPSICTEVPGDVRIHLTNVRNVVFTWRTQCAAVPHSGFRFSRSRAPDKSPHPSTKGLDHGHSSSSPL